MVGKLYATDSSRFCRMMLMIVYFFPAKALFFCCCHLKLFLFFLRRIHNKLQQHPIFLKQESSLVVVFIAHASAACSIDGQYVITSYKLTCLFKPPLATARVASCIGAVHLFVCLSVSLSVCRQNAQNATFPKTKQFRAMVSIVDL